MLPHRPHNYANSPNSYHFDMRVNVDFASGHVQLALPRHTPHAQQPTTTPPTPMLFPQLAAIHPVPLTASRLPATVAV